jgi:hypothetical protein
VAAAAALGGGGLWFGSCDPHGVGDVDRAPAARVRMLSLAAHVAASAQELDGRAFPVLNGAAVTPRCAPPAPQPAAPPRVTCRLAIAPAATWRLVHRWERRLRRYFRAAARGDASLARRLRPDDLWLPHAEHSCPATAPWDWDLRPLALGSDAVPLPVSGRDGVLPATSLVLPAVAALGVRYADQGILAEAGYGISDDSLCQRGTLLCAPHAGAAKQLSTAVAKAMGDVESGWATGPHEFVPCWPLRTCPYSLVDESERAGKPKFRLTIDLSWPFPTAMPDGAGGYVDSVNGAMDRSQWPAERMLRVAEVADAAAVLTGGGPAAERRRVRLWGFDCRAFYRTVGRQRRELWRNCIVLPGGYRLDERCCFGDASAAAKCVRLSNFLASCIRSELASFDAAHPTRDAVWVEWQSRRRATAAARGLGRDAAADFCALHAFGMYVDDGSGASADDLLFTADGSPVLAADGSHMRRAQAHFEAALRVIVRLGFESEESKAQPPSTILVCLGIEIDLLSWRIRLTDHKRRRYSAAAADAAASSALTPAAFDRLVGRLQFAAQCYPIGRQHLHALWRVARVASRRRDGALPLSRRARDELRWWVRMLGSPLAGAQAACGPLAWHDGVPLARCGDPPPIGGGASAVYADASGEGGWLAWSLSGRTVLLAHGAWLPDARQLLIQEKELLASTWGLVAFSPWLPQHVTSFSDNTVAASAMISAAPRSPRMQQIAARRSQWLLDAGHVEHVQRVTSKGNVWADVGSRPELGGAAATERLARGLGFHVLHVAVPPEWLDVSALDGEREWC